MALFEVFIPGKEAGMPNVTLTIEAQNWIGALRSGLKSIGEGQEAIANVMCDIKEDNSIHVTDVATRRVFRLRETSPKLDPQTLVEVPAGSMEADDDETLKNVRPEDFGAQPKTLIEFPMPSQKVALPDAEASVPWTKMPGPASSSNLANAALAQASLAPAPVTTPGGQRLAPAAAAPVAAAPAPAAVPSTSKVTKPVTKPTAPPTPRGVPAPAPKRPSGQFASASDPVTREVTAPQPTDPRIGRAAGKSAPVDVQDAIAAVFDATQDLYMEPALSPQHVADKLLDIALAHIPADSGTFYLADVNGHELVFSAVRGPKAAALKKSGVTLKVGQGIIGFCAQEGVCLVVNDIQKDPRFYAAIAKSIDYQPKDTLCASAEKEGRLWGALQIINSKGGFDASHMEVLRFIGLTAATMLERIDDRRGG